MHGNFSVATFHDRVTFTSRRVKIQKIHSTARGGLAHAVYIKSSILATTIDYFSMVIVRATEQILFNENVQIFKRHDCSDKQFLTYFGMVECILKE